MDLTDEIAEQEGMSILGEEKPEKSEEPEKESTETTEEPEKEEPEGEPEKTDEESETEPEGEEKPDEDQPKQEPEKSDPVKVINSIFGNDSFKSVDDLKKKVTLADDLQNKYGELEKKNQQLQEQLLKNTNPLNFFADENEYKKQMLIKKHPDLNRSALSRVISKDVDNMDPLAAIKNRMMLEHGDIFQSEAEVMEAIADKYDVDFSEESLDDLPSVKRNKIKLEAKEAKKYFKQLSEEIEMPEEANPEALKKKFEERVNGAKEAWNGYLQSDTFKEGLSQPFKFKTKAGDFEFKVDDKWLQDTSKRVDDVVEALSNQGAVPEDKDKQAFLNNARNIYLTRNLEKMLDSFASDVISQLSEKEFEELHNPKKSKEASPGPKKSKEQESKEKFNREVEKDL